MTKHDSDEPKTQKPKTPLTPFGGWSTPQEGGPQPVVSQPDGSQKTSSQDEVYKGAKKKVDYSKIRSFSATFGVVDASIPQLDEALQEKDAAQESDEKPAIPPAVEGTEDAQALANDDPFAFNPSELPENSKPRKLEALKEGELKSALKNHDQLASGFTFASGSVVGTASIVEVDAAPAPAESFDNPFSLETEKEEPAISSSWNFSAEEDTLPPAKQDDDLSVIEPETTQAEPEEDMLFNPFKIAFKETRSTPAISEELNAPDMDAPVHVSDQPENDPFALPDFVKKEQTGEKIKGADAFLPAEDKGLNENAQEISTSRSEGISMFQDGKEEDKEKTLSVFPEESEKPEDAKQEEIAPFGEDISAPVTAFQDEEKGEPDPFLPSQGASPFQNGKEERKSTPPIFMEEPLKQEDADEQEEMMPSLAAEDAPDPILPVAEPSPSEEMGEKAKEDDMPVETSPSEPVKAEKDDSIPAPLFESGEQVGQDRLIVNSDAQEVTFNPFTAPQHDPFGLSDFTEEADDTAAQHTPAFGQRTPSAEAFPPRAETAPVMQEPEMQPEEQEPFVQETVAFAPAQPEFEEEGQPFTPADYEEEEALSAPASHSPAEIETILMLHSQWLQSRGKDGRRANFRNASLEHVQFAQQNLSEASFRGANLNGANFEGASLQGADLSEASLVGVNFNGVDLSNVMAMRADIRHSALESACLVNADFTGASLAGANLRHLDMSGVTLMEADLHHADLQGSLLRGANLRSANLAQSNLHQVDLSDANCRDTVFHGTRVTFAQVEGANFKGARLEGVDFKGTDITRAEELDPEYTQETMQAGMEQLNEQWGKIEQRESELGQLQALLESERTRLNAEKQQLMDELESTRRDKRALEDFVQSVDDAFKRHKQSIKRLKVFTVLWGLITLLLGAGIFLLVNALELKTLDWMELSVVFGFSVFILGMFISTTLRCLAITSNFRKLRELMQQRVTSSR